MFMDQNETNMDSMFGQNYNGQNGPSQNNYGRRCSVSGLDFNTNPNMVRH